MTNVEEFVFIAAQLAWLEAHLRSQAAAQNSRMEGALNALACAQAVISELGCLGRSAEKLPMASCGMRF